MEQDKNMYPVVKVDGFVEKGKQFDLDITIPEDNRDVIYGVIRDCYREPVQDAVVKLVEIEYYHGKKVRKPVSHTFTDKDGEFVFGPLCPDKKYEIQIFVNKVKHVKVCSKCHREGKCLKGIDLKKCDCFVGKKEDLEKCKEKCDYKKDDEKKYDEKYDEKYEDKYFTKKDEGYGKVL